MEKLEENKQEKYEDKEDFHRKMMKFALETVFFVFFQLTLTEESKKRLKKALITLKFLLVVFSLM